MFMNQYYAAVDTVADQRIAVGRDDILALLHAVHRLCSFLVTPTAARF